MNDLRPNVGVSAQSSGTKKGQGAAIDFVVSDGAWLRRKHQFTILARFTRAESRVSLSCAAFYDKPAESVERVRPP